MAIKVNGTTVINDSRALSNIASVDATTVATLNAGGVGGSGFEPTTVSGTSQTLNVGSFNFFDGGTMSETTSVSFSSIPSGASEWRYSYVPAADPAQAYFASNWKPTGGVSTIDGFITRSLFGHPTDGTKIYQRDYYGYIYEITLGTAFDLSTADVANKVQGTQLSQGSNMDYGQMVWTNNGTFLTHYNYFNGYLQTHVASTAYDVTTIGASATYYKNMSGIQDSVYGVCFDPTGTKMVTSDFTAGYEGVKQFTLSTPWRIDTAGTASANMSIGGPRNIYFSATGSHLIFQRGDTVKQLPLSTAYDVTTWLASDGEILPSPTMVQDIGFFIMGNGVAAGVATNGANPPTVYEYSIAGSTKPNYPGNVTGETIPNAIGARTTDTLYTTDGGTNITVMGTQ
jgi:negative regulator of replication initiation